MKFQEDSDCTIKVPEHEQVFVYYLSDVKKAMKTLGIEPCIIDMNPRIHASDMVKIADYISMEV